MKVVILAGGRGRRLQEQTRHRPKALVEIGGRPILWHLLQYFRHFDYSDFLVAGGYRCEALRAYCANLDFPCPVLDTGAETGTGGRLKRLASHLSETFLFTWCDGLTDLDLAELVHFHRHHGKLATVTVVHPPARFGYVTLNEDSAQVQAFDEKPARPRDWINGAFFVLEPEILNYIKGDETDWERGPLPALAKEGQLMAWRHEGFWQCMDTIHETNALNELWARGAAPWRVT